VKPFAAGATRDLLKIARRQDDGILTIELAELSEQHRANGDVDPDTQGIGSADDAQQSLLRQLLDEATILGQHSRVVDADTVRNEAREFFAERTSEPKPR